MFKWSVQICFAIDVLVFVSVVVTVLVRVIICDIIGILVHRWCFICKHL